MPNLLEVQGATDQIVEMLDRLPILATIIGVRSDEHEAGASTARETALMGALFAVHARWQEVKP